MNRKAKVVLCSAFIFPGLGHFMCGRRWVGLVVLAVSFAALSVVMLFYYGLASDLTEAVVQGRVALEVDQVVAALLELKAASSNVFVTVSPWVLLGAWLFAIVDLCVRDASVL